MKRPKPERLAELEAKARAIRIEQAIENSPALHQVSRGVKYLDRALTMMSLPKDIQHAVARAADLIEVEMQKLGDAPKVEAP